MNQPKDTRSSFEKAVTGLTEGVNLRLFIAGMAPRSTRAVADLRNLCSSFGDRCTVEIVDIYENPRLARDAQIVAVPTLVRDKPLPRRKLIGDFADTMKVAQSLGLQPRENEGTA